MNTENEKLRFDLLVDGELDEAQRRDLLAGLDDEPNGWRNCALAFLESQCWKQALSASPRPQAEEVPGTREESPHQKALTLSLSQRERGQLFAPAGTSAAIPIRKRSPWLRRLATGMAMAASFAAAVYLGSLFRSSSLGSGGGLGIENQLAKVDPQQPVWNQSNPLTNSNDGLAKMQPREDSPSNPWRVVTVSSPSNGQSPGQSFNVPAIERDNIDEQWVRSLPPAIPEDVRRALNRTGHEILQRRELVPVPLKDGRQLVMPVDQVEVHYVGNDSD
jgi:hypothetical protein